MKEILTEARDMAIELDGTLSVLKGNLECTLEGVKALESEVAGLKLILPKRITTRTKLNEDQKIAKERLDVLEGNRVTLEVISGNIQLNIEALNDQISQLHALQLRIIDLKLRDLP